MPGFMPGIHAFLGKKAWMAGTSPAMTWQTNKKPIEEAPGKGQNRPSLRQRELL
jgi:hypothetical protein